MRFCCPFLIGVRFSVALGSKCPRPPVPAIRNPNAGSPAQSAPRFHSFGFSNPDIDLAPLARIAALHLRVAVLVQHVSEASDPDHAASASDAGEPLQCSRL